MRRAGDFRKSPATQQQLQGTWRAYSPYYGTYEEYCISGNHVTYKSWKEDGTGTYWSMSGELTITKTGFQISGYLNRYSADGTLLEEDPWGTVNHVVISAITSDYFVDSFDDNGPVTYYKQ